MSRYWVFAAVPGVLVLVALVLVVVLLLLKLLWAWTIPDLFPGAVEQGLVAGTISWYTAVEVAIFFAVLTAVAGANRDKSKRFSSALYWFGPARKGHRLI